MVTPVEVSAITNEESGSLNMVFQFEHMGLDSAPGGNGKWDYQPWRLADLKKVTSRWQYGLEGRGWNSLYLSNHDQPRSVSRFGNDGPYRVESAKLLGTFNQMLQGTPYIYQGEEIGMTNVRFESITDYQDIESLNMYREAVEKVGLDPRSVLEKIHIKGRDNARTPFQWNIRSQAGFTTGTPWIKVNPNYHSINAEQALADPDSIFHYYQKLIQLRKAHPIIVYGKYDLILEPHEQIFAFTRTLGDERLLVILNFSSEPSSFDLPAEISYQQHALLIGNYAVDPGQEPRQFILQPYEARVYQFF